MFIVVFHSAPQPSREQFITDWRNEREMEAAVLKAYPRHDHRNLFVNNLPRYTILSDRGLFITGG